MPEAAPPALQTLAEPVDVRLTRVRESIERMVDPEFDPLGEVAGYLLEMRGKLLRPTLLLLANEVGGRPREEAVTLGAVVELVHLATLVHDDAVDHSVRRRGMPTVNARWTHQVAVIMGDYLYSRAVIEMSRLGDVEAIELLARAANRMTVGEMRQLMAHDALDFSEADYDRLCECKTASLMSASTELGAMFGAREHRAPLRDYGFELGMAFQITDDLLDYTGSSTVTGKPRGQDLREHKVTLPLIAALPRMSGTEREEVKGLFAEAEPSEARLERVIDAVERRGGLEYARSRAEEYLQQARRRLTLLPEGPAVRSLEQAVEFVVHRRK